MCFTPFCTLRYTRVAHPRREKRSIASSNALISHHAASACDRCLFDISWKCTALSGPDIASDIAPNPAIDSAILRL